MNWLDSWLKAHETELVEFRRDLHAHPELGHQESRTTELLLRRLRAAGLSPVRLPAGTGVICDVGPGEPAVALRADIDALPLPDTKSVPYRSTVDGVCHACGHDVHTTVALGAALALAAVPELPGAVRFVFQPAEEVMPGGALAVLAAGALNGIRQIFALHCDPRQDVGQVGLRTGPITAAADWLEIAVSGPGGHTSRPHLTVDTVYALGRLITDLPGLLSRAVDPRSGLSLVWGAVNSGVAFNAIPQTGVLRGTVRILDSAAWHDAEKLIRRLVAEIVAPTGALAEVDYARGVPPVVNEVSATGVLRAGIVGALGECGLADTPQSMGGEDFGWYLEGSPDGAWPGIPGALARLGVYGGGRRPDLHQGSFDVDEGCIPVGVRVFVHTALAALDGA
ncbi:MAG TPA: amidohydrolase [Mycobacteriales bacterium]|jgi:amidohydrolase|nr:amidohydrolase [Mycobacteriales bacterium]